jgi:Spy/CpxP family protein refolding chaperone
MIRRARTVSTAFLALLATLSVLAPAPAEAQSQGREIMPEAPPIEDGELRSFAHLYLDVAEVRDDLQHDLEDASGQAEAQRLQQEARDEMQSLVEESDFTIERYTQIGQILNVDPEQRAEFQALVEEIRADEGNGVPS